MTIPAFIAICGTSDLHKNLYRFTDRRNLPLIIKEGLLATAELKRRAITPFATGGNEASLQIDIHAGMDEYVHLCFTRNHPLLYLAKQRGNIVDGVYIAVSLQVLTVPGTRISVGVAIANDATIHPVTDIMAVLDKDVIYQRTDWKDPAIMARLRMMEKSEILVPTAVPRRFLLGTHNG